MLWYLGDARWFLCQVKGEGKVVPVPN